MQVLGDSEQYVGCQLLSCWYGVIHRSEMGMKQIAFVWKWLNWLQLMNEVVIGGCEEENSI